MPVNVECVNQDDTLSAVYEGEMDKFEIGSLHTLNTELLVSVISVDR